MKHVCVVYEETRTGLTSLRMALDAARLFCSHSPLQVFVATDESTLQLLGDEKHATANSVLVERVRQRVAEFAGTQLFEVRTYATNSRPEFANNSLLVGRGIDDRNFDTLMPANEFALEARRVGPILIPFSDGGTGLVAAAAGIELALKWRECRTLTDDTAEVIFYHTTWPDSTGRSPHAVDQMCNDAKRVMLSVQKAAQDKGVRYKTIVETHDDVVQGVVEKAQQTGAVLILMARGALIRQGSYVNRTVLQSPIPVFIAKTGLHPVAARAGDSEVATFEAGRSQQLLLESIEPHVPWYRRLIELPLLRNPLFVTGVVVVLYMLKAAAKIAVGTWIHSPTITGDGFHNVADVLEAVAIGAVLVIAARNSGGRYPYGRKNMEWFTSLLIGLMLFVAAGKFIVDCVIGLISFVPAIDEFVRAGFPGLPVHESVHIDGNSFPWVLAVTISSFLMSLVLSRYQILVGKRTGHASLVANGEEAKSDGWIEAVTVIGVVAQFTTGFRVIEYVLGLLVAALIIRTAKDLFLAGWRVLLQHSIGVEHEAAISQACLRISDVEGVPELKTFQVGHTAVVMVTCQSLSESHGMTYVKQAVESAIRSYVLAEGSDFKGCDIHVKMQRPDPRRHRVGYGLALGSAGQVVLARRLSDATHVAVCDVEHGDIVRSKVLPLSDNAVALMKEKRMQTLYLFEPPANQPAMQAATAYVLATLGLTV